MGRRLTGSVESLPSGRFRASLPAVRGSAQRVAAIFDTHAGAELWVARGVAQLRETGRLDEPALDPGRTTSARPADVAEALIARLERTRERTPERIETLRRHWRRHLGPYLEVCGIVDVAQIRATRRT